MNHPWGDYRMLYFGYAGVARLGRLLLCVVLLCSVGALIGPAPLQAQNKPPELPQFTGISVGLGGAYKLGEWTRLEFSLVGGTEAAIGQLWVMVPDGDGVMTRVGTFENRAVQILPGQQVKVAVYAMIGRESSILVELRLANGKVVRETFGNYDFRKSFQVPMPLGYDDTLWVVVGQSPKFNLNTSSNAEESSDPFGGSEPEQHVVQLPDASHLPHHYLGYDAVDLLVLAPSQLEEFRRLVPGSTQHAALTQWMSLGGRMYLCVGNEAPQMLAPGSPLAEFLPGDFTDMTTLRDTAALERFAAAGRIPLGGRSDRLELSVPRVRARGKVLIEEQGLPLALRGSYGFGEVVFVALDLARPPLVDWNGQPQFNNKLLETTVVSNDAAGEQQAQVARQYGIYNFAGQLHGALDEFTNVRVVPFGIVGILIFVYILLIGPGDYLFVRRVLRRMELTWITFPLIVLVTSLGAYGAARVIKGNELLVNQVDVVDVDTSSGQLRGTSWLKVFTPSTAAFNFSQQPSEASLAPPQGPTQRVFTWWGNSGEGWQGMHGGEATGLFSRDYRFSPLLDSLQEVPIDIWSTKSFAGSWQGTTEARIESRLLTGSDGALRGKITNRLPFKLDNAILIHGTSAYTIQDLQPDGSFEPLQISKRDLGGLLKDFRSVANAQGSSTHFQAQRWDSSGRNPDSIVPLMLFYQAVDGKAYTGLSNAQMSRLDMSSLLRCGKAVLLTGVQTHDSAAALLDGTMQVSNPRDQRWVFYRFVLDVGEPLLPEVPTADTPADHTPAAEAPAAEAPAVDDAPTESSEPADSPSG